MPRRQSKRNAATKTPKKRKRRFPLSRILPSARTRRALVGAFRSAPGAVQVLLAVCVLATVWLCVNWTYQVFRKPSELFFPVSGALYKEPTQTWRAYKGLFRRHSTRVMAPDLLAALAQVEGSGNPIVRTYWRWALTHQPFDIYRPASSAVGMYQITDGTFADARRFCIRNHAVAVEGPWYAFRTCWFNEFYTRTVPSHAVELTSAYLDRRVAEMLARYPSAKPTLQQQQNIAALMHLCGPGVASAYARRGFAPAPGQRCGTHDVRGYLAKVNEMRRVFARLDAAG
jgi:hypothetical protein